MEKQIENHEVDFMTETKNYIVLNDGDKGLLIFDKKINYIKSIIFREKLSIGMMDSSDKNDFVLIQDNSDEKLCLINVEDDNCIEGNIEKSFRNYFFSTEESFTLRRRDERMITFKYQTFPKIELIEPISRFMPTVRSNYNDKILCRDSNENLVYGKEILASPPSGAYDFKVYKKDIVSFSEDKLYLYRNKEWVVFFEVSKAETEEIVSCSINDTSVIILVNFKHDETKSILFSKKKCIPK